METWTERLGVIALCVVTFLTFVAAVMIHTRDYWDPPSAAEIKYREALKAAPMVACLSMGGTWNRIGICKLPADKKGGKQ
jgi:hypothetical protein